MLAAGGDPPLAGDRALPPPKESITRVDVTPEMVQQIGHPGQCRLCTGVERTVDPNAAYAMFRARLIDYETFRRMAGL